MENENRSFRDLWSWSEPLTRLVALSLVVAGSAITAAAYPRLGIEALWFLLLALGGPMHMGIYGVVGSKVRALQRAKYEGAKEVAQSLIVIGKLQAPGVAVLYDNKLRLITIVGKDLSIDLDEVTTVRVRAFFNGKSLIWKKWLVVKTEPKLGFALPATIATNWQRSILGTSRY